MWKTGKVSTKLSVLLVSKILPSLDWVAGFFEGEGNATIRNHTKTKGRVVYPCLALQVAQVHREPLDALCEILKAGKVRGPYGPYSTTKQPYYQWSVVGKESIAVAEKLIPLMFHKGEQVQQALDKYKEYLNV